MGDPYYTSLLRLAGGKPHGAGRWFSGRLWRPVSLQCPLQLRYQCIDLVQALGHRFGQQLTPHFLTLDRNLVHLGNADKAEGGDQVRFQMVHMGHRAASVKADPASGREDDGMAWRGRSASFGT